MSILISMSGGNDTPLSGMQTCSVVVQITPRYKSGMNPPVAWSLMNQLKNKGVVKCNKTDNDMHLKEYIKACHNLIVF